MDGWLGQIDAGAHEAHLVPEGGKEGGPPSQNRHFFFSCKQMDKYWAVLALTSLILMF